MQHWDADFVAFSSHKILGPSGIGALWGRYELLDAMPPFLGGGEMIRDVRLDGFTTNDLPWKFEAGTPAIVEAVGFGAAIDYIAAIGMDAVRAHERLITRYALEALHDRFGDSLTIYGPDRRATCGAARCRSCSTGSTPTTSARSSTRTRCASGPATTAPSR